MSQTSHRSFASHWTIILLLLIALTSAGSSRAQACIPTPTPTPIYSAQLGPVNSWTRPKAPTALTASPDQANPTNKINLAWTDNSGKESGYRIERSANGASGWTALTPLTAANATSYVDSTVSPGTTNYYRVMAFIAGGSESLPSNATGPVDTPPSAPSTVSIHSASASSLEISWPAVSGATGYRIYRASAESGTYVRINSPDPLSATTLAYTDPGLDPSTPYWYKITALHNGAESALSGAGSNSTLTGPVLQVTGATGTLMTIDSAGNLTLVDGANVVPQYTQGVLDGYQSTSADVPWLLRSATITLAALVRNPTDGKFNLLIRGTLHSNSSDGGPQMVPTHFSSVQCNATTPVASFTANGDLYLKGTTSGQAIVPVSDLSAQWVSTSPSGIQLVWTADSTLHFDVLRTETPDIPNSYAVPSPAITANYNGAANRWEAQDVNGLEGGHVYYYKVRATQGAQSSDLSNQAAAVVPVGDLATSWLVEPDNKVQLTWTGDNGLTYRLARAIDDSSSYDDSIPFTISLFEPNGHKVLDDQVQAGHVYHYRVVTSKDELSSVFSNTPGLIVPVADLNATLNPVNNSVHLTWTAATGLNFALFRTEANPDLVGSYPEPIPSAELTVIETSSGHYEADITSALSAGHVYFYKVQASHNGLVSGLSNKSGLIVPPILTGGWDQSNKVVDLNLFLDPRITYMLNRYENSALINGTAVTQVPVEDSNGQPGHTYEYEVVATMAGLVQVVSNRISVAIPTPPPLDPPGQLTVTSDLTAKTSKFILTWPLYGLGDISIERSTTGNDQNFTVIEANYTQSDHDATNARYVDTVPNTGHYFYRICGVDQTGRKSTYVNADCWTYPSSNEFIGGFSVNATQIHLAWEWDESADSCIIKRDGQILNQVCDEELGLKDHTKEKFQDEDLEPNQKYTYTIYFSNPGETEGEFKLSEPKTIEVTTLPSISLHLEAITEDGNPVDVNMTLQVPGIEGYSDQTINLDPNLNIYEQTFDKPATVSVIAPMVSNEQYTLVKWLVGSPTADGNAMSYADMPISADHKQTVTMDVNHTIKAVYSTALMVRSISRQNDMNLKLDVKFSSLMQMDSDKGAYIRVFGSESGQLQGSFGNLGGIPSDIYRFIANRSNRARYVPGEEISASIIKASSGDSNGLQDNTSPSHSLSRSYVWTGYAQAGAADDPTSFGQALHFGLAGTAVTSVAVGDLRGDGQSMFAVIGVKGGPTFMQLFDPLYNFSIEDLNFNIESFCQQDDSLDHREVVYNTSAVAVGDLGKYNIPDCTVDNLTDIIVANNPGPLYAYIARWKNIWNDTTLDYDKYSYYRRMTIESGDNKATALAIGDLNGDGRNDIAVGYDHQVNKIFFNQVEDNGDVSFSINNAISFGNGNHKVSAVKLADFENDGDLDIAVAYWGEKGEIYLNDGLGNFTKTINYGQAMSLATSLTVGDFNRDGYPDFAVGNLGQANEVYLNQQDLTFKRSLLVGVDGQPMSDLTTAIITGDFNGDGWLDLAVGNSGAEPNPIYLNQGAGVFKLGSWIGVDNTICEDTRALAAGDFDRDGDLDLVVANQADKSAIYLREPSIFVPTAKDSFSTLYDWASGLKKDKLISKPLLGPSSTSHYNDSSQTANPRVVTDGQGHWVSVWSTNANLNYKQYGDQNQTNYSSYTDTKLKNFSSQGKYNIVISKFWDMGKTGNKYDPLGQDPWRTLQVDEDTLWSPPVPIDPAQAEGAQKDFTWPDITTDKNGIWAVVWTENYGYDYYRTNYNGNDSIFPHKVIDDPGENVFQLSNGYMVDNINYGHLYLTMSIDEAGNGTNATSWMPSLDLVPNGIYDGPYKPTIVSDGNAHGEYMIIFSGQLSNNSAKGIFYIRVYFDYDSATSKYILKHTGPALICNEDGSGGYVHGVGDWANACLDLYGSFYNVANVYPLKEIRYNTIGLDLATDGDGNWIAVWNNQESAKDGDIVYSYYQKATHAWSKEGLLNSWGDIDYPLGSDGINNNNVEHDMNPAIDYANGKYIVFWESAYNHYDRASNPEDDSYNDKGSDYDIMYSSTTPEALSAGYHADSTTWDSHTWSVPTVLNADAFVDNSPSTDINQPPSYKKDILPEVTHSGQTWLVAWKTYQVVNDRPEAENEKRTIRYAISTDNGETWDSNASNQILGEMMPYERKTMPALAADNDGHFMAVFKAWDDIVSACSPGLVTPDRARRLLPEPTPTPTPIPEPLAHNNADPTLDPVYINHYPMPDGTPAMQILSQLSASSLADFTHPNSDDLAGLFDTTGALWTLKNSETDSPNQATMTIFHMPILGTNGINALNELRYFDLAFKACRQTVADPPVSVPMDIELWIYKYQQYGGNYWKDYNAWCWVNTWTDVSDLSQELSYPIYSTSIYIKPPVPEDVIDPIFGGTADGSGGVTVPAGYITFAIVVRQKDPQGQVSFDYVKANLYPSYLKGAAVEPYKILIPSMRQTTYNPNALTAYAEIQGSQMDPKNISVGHIGAGRLTLSASSSGQTQSSLDTLTAHVEVIDPPQGVKVQLTYPSDGIMQTKVIEPQSPECNTIFTLSLGSSDLNNDLVTSIIGDKAYIEILENGGQSGGGTVIARGKLHVDSDDDGLTDDEELNIYNLACDSSVEPQRDRDSDDDGLLDGEELLKLGLLANTPKGSDPTKVDSDGDGLSDSLEVGLQLKTAPGEVVKALSDRVEECGVKNLYYNQIKVFSAEIQSTATPRDEIYNIPTGLQLVDADLLN